ncbi:MAG: Rieske (2Fe-2S) protein [Desulfurella sp.]|uniref:QcrA and Rieske domain-containing protein n=1 Tax=Desulfurella sp. TaxID=1962857 RepID=UPI000CBE05EE|nr:Rieske (2Fe-2S) protein [Desulfurella sp.]PMP91827.1 MAG: Rieske (2Fe-2S) protein [Desulfurella sp.]
MDEKQITNQENQVCQACITRRKILKASMGIAGISLLGATLSFFGTIKPQSSKANERKPITPGDKLVYAMGPKKGQTITQESLKLDKGALAFPLGKEEHLNLIMIIHEVQAEFKPPTHLNWVINGIVAYSAICTHMGCTVDWHPKSQKPAPYPHIFCPCHQSMYNIFEGAKVVSGPAPRPLPQLPIKLNPNNEIVADGDFDGPVGPMV